MSDASLFAVADFQELRLQPPTLRDVADGDWGSGRRLAKQDGHTA
jgi:hypothetical protein